MQWSKTKIQCVEIMEICSLCTIQPTFFYFTHFVIAWVEIISQCVHKFVRLCGFNFKGKAVPMMIIFYCLLLPIIVYYYCPLLSICEVIKAKRERVITLILLLVLLVWRCHCLSFCFVTKIDTVATLPSRCQTGRGLWNLGGKGLQQVCSKSFKLVI